MTDFNQTLFNYVHDLEDYMIDYLTDDEYECLRDHQLAKIKGMLINPPQYLLSGIESMLGKEFDVDQLAFTVAMFQYMTTEEFNAAEAYACCYNLLGTEAMETFDFDAAIRQVLKHN